MAYYNTGANIVDVQPGMPAGAGPQNWMTVPQSIPGCPPGLEYLTMLDQVLVHQKVELLEAFTGWETNNKYVVKNSMEQQVYYAFEKSGTCMRICCGPSRKYTIHIVDNSNKEVIRIRRPFKCCAGNCWCAGCCDGCAQETYIEAPPGNLVGTVKQTGISCALKFDLFDSVGSKQLSIEGPCCCCMCTCGCGACAGDVEFPVFDKGGATVGCISKQWSGFAQECCTVADNFAITFPIDLDVKMKATLLGALFLIDFMAFEDKKKNDDHDN